LTLTGELRDRRSPLARFLREHFPNTRAIAADVRIEAANATTIRPAASLGRHSSTIGTAFDWRLRFYLSAEPGRGLRPTTGMDPDWSAFLASLDDVVRRVRPVGRRLGRLAEDLLNRYCVVLALAEQIWRAGPIAVRQSLLFELEPKRRVADFLAIARVEWLDDLRALSWTAYDALADQLRQPAILNPTFDGSSDIGGADGDLILGDCLVEIKTTLNPRWNRDWLYQLLGYVLLDYTDRYRIRSIGIYLARQSVFVRWRLDEVIRLCSPYRSDSLDQLRADLVEALHQSKCRPEGPPFEPAPALRLGPNAHPRHQRREEGLTSADHAGIQLELPGFRVE
jgi:hypothetical protein